MNWTPGPRQRRTRTIPPSGVLLARVEEWYPPVPMSAVLSQLELSDTAKADFEAGVVRITAGEYETVLAVAAERAPSTG